ncbi:related to cell wall protein PhiA [Fusarium fujikuroi]|nr:related to cell wall protein PhiA [Fusarium fujikuroi]
MEELPELVFYLTSNPSGKEVARQIARQGRQWHTRAFREVDMGLYVYRLLLEMARLQDPQRKANYGLAAAAPTEECASTKTAPAKSGNSPAPKTFGLVALRSGSPIHFTHFSASENGFLLGLPADKQNATCSGKSDGSAVFRLSEGELYLYNTGKKQQRAYTDRSGMGQGVLQYSTVTKNPLPEAFETKGWKIDKSGNLNFADASGFTACPNGPDGSWAVWVATGNSRPGYSEKECLGFNARVSEIEHATSCFYSEYSG